jgi:hypothetical protein
MDTEKCNHIYQNSVKNKNHTCRKTGIKPHGFSVNGFKGLHENACLMNRNWATLFHIWGQFNGSNMCNHQK